VDNGLINGFCDRNCNGAQSVRNAHAPCRFHARSARVLVFCIALYSDIYIALLTAKSLTEALLIAITSSINSTVSYRPIIM